MSLSRNATRSLKERYEDFKKIGEGAYGVVYRARDSDTNRLVAVKKMGCQDSQEDGEDGVSAATLREMSILKELKHPNIVSLLETYYERKTTYLVFEFIDFDLKKYLDLSKRSEQPFKIDGLKIMFHLLNATEYLHSRGIIHRDIKPQNILVDKNKSVKLADFGLSRFYLPSVTMTHEVVTLWYRAPEVLLGIKRYTAAVDVWSLGCIFAELSNRKPLFSGDSEVDQLFRIFQVQGTPSSENSPSLCELKQYNAKMPKWKKVNLSQKCPKMNHLEIDLLEKMLELDPLKRISVRKALQHSVFAQIQP